MHLLLLNILFQQGGDNFQPGTALGGLFCLLMVVIIIIRIFKKKPTRKNEPQPQDIQRGSDEDPLEAAIAARRAAVSAKSAPIQATSDPDQEASVDRQLLGTRDQAAKFCPHCGKPLLSSDNFCTTCGTPRRERIIEQTSPTGSNEASYPPTSYGQSDLNEEIAEKYFAQAYDYNENSEYEKALDVCDKVIELAPDWSDGHNLRGVILEDMGHLEEGISEYRAAVRLDNADVDARENLALALKESAKGRSGARKGNKAERSIDFHSGSKEPGLTPKQGSIEQGKSSIITCPYCKMRILPRPDGTCPSCQTTISSPDQKASHLATSRPAGDRKVPGSGSGKPAGQWPERMSIVTNWFNQHKEQPIQVNVISIYEGKEDPFISAHGKVRCIEEHPTHKGCFRIEFDSKLQPGSEFDRISLGYEVSGVVEEDQQLVIRKGTNQRIEITAGIEEKPSELDASNSLAAPSSNSESTPSSSEVQRSENSSNDKEKDSSRNSELRDVEILKELDPLVKVLTDNFGLFSIFRRNEYPQDDSPGWRISLLLRNSAALEYLSECDSCMKSIGIRANAFSDKLKFGYPDFMETLSRWVEFVPLSKLFANDQEKFWYFAENYVPTLKKQFLKVFFGVFHM